MDCESVQNSAAFGVIKAKNNQWVFEFGMFKYKTHQIILWFCYWSLIRIVILENVELMRLKIYCILPSLKWIKNPAGRHASYLDIYNNHSFIQITVTYMQLFEMIILRYFLSLCKLIILELFHWVEFSDSCEIDAFFFIMITNQR